jgi:hypothetical protein
MGAKKSNAGVSKEEKPKPKSWQNKHRLKLDIFRRCETLKEEC